MQYRYCLTLDTLKFGEIVTDKLYTKIDKQVMCSDIAFRYDVKKVECHLMTEK